MASDSITSWQKDWEKVEMVVVQYCGYSNATNCTLLFICNLTKKPLDEHERGE